MPSNLLSRPLFLQIMMDTIDERPVLNLLTPRSQVYTGYLYHLYV